jgi:hypothetical protein
VAAVALDLSAHRCRPLGANCGNSGLTERPRAFVVKRPFYGAVQIFSSGAPLCLQDFLIEVIGDLTSYCLGLACEYRFQQRGRSFENLTSLNVARRQRRFRFVQLSVQLSSVDRTIGFAREFCSGEARIASTN